MTSIFLLVLLYAFPVTHLYVPEDQNEELLKNDDFQFDNTKANVESSALDSKRRKNVFNADLDSLDTASDETDVYDYDESPEERKKPKKRKSVTVFGDVTTSSKYKYHMNATFQPVKSESFDGSASCTVDGKDKVEVTANLTVVRKEGPKTVYKLGVTFHRADKKVVETVVARCNVKTNTGKLFEMKLDLKRFQQKSRRKLIKKHVQLDEKKKDKVMVYGSRQTAQLIGKGF